MKTLLQVNKEYLIKNISFVFVLLAVVVVGSYTVYDISTTNAQFSGITILPVKEPIGPIGLTGSTLTGGVPNSGSTLTGSTMGPCDRPVVYGYGYGYQPGYGYGYGYGYMQNKTYGENVPYFYLTKPYIAISEKIYKKFKDVHSLTIKKLKAGTIEKLFDKATLKQMQKDISDYLDMQANKAKAKMNKQYQEIIKNKR